MRFKLSLVALSLCCISNPALALSPAGKTMIARGDVKAFEDAAEQRKLKRRAPIFDVDTVTTAGQSKAQFRMNDGTLLALKENTTLLISEYKYNEADSNNSAVLELVEGGLRSVTGAIKANDGTYELKTPVGSIGIRGTHYEVEIIEGDVFLAVWDGAIDVNVGGSNDSVSLGEGEDFSFATISEDGEVTELLEPPENFSEGHSDDGESEEESDGELEDDSEEESDEESVEETEEESGEETEEESEEESGDETEAESEDESAGESEEDSNNTDDPNNADESDNSDGSESDDANTSDNGDSESTGGSSGPENDTSSEDPQSGSTSGAPDSGDTTGQDDGAGDTTIETDTGSLSTDTSPTIDDSSDTSSGTELDSENSPIPDEDEQVRDEEIERVIDNNTQVAPEIIAARTGSANYSTLISSSLTGNQNPRNLNVNISVNFDTSFSEGNLSVVDDGGNWDAAFQGVIVESDLELDMTRVTYGQPGVPGSVQVGSGSISAFFANEGDVLNGNFNLTQGSNRVGGNFLVRE